MSLAVDERALVLAGQDGGDMLLWEEEICVTLCVVDKKAALDNVHII